MKVVRLFLAVVFCLSCSSCRKYDTICGYEFGSVQSWVQGETRDTFGSTLHVRLHTPFAGFSDAVLYLTPKTRKIYRMSFWKSKTAPAPDAKKNWMDENSMKEAWYIKWEVEEEIMKQFGRYTCLERTRPSSRIDEGTTETMTEILTAKTENLDFNLSLAEKVYFHQSSGWLSSPPTRTTEATLTITDREVLARAQKAR